MDKIATKQRVDSVNEWMRSRPFEPDVAAQVVFARNDRYEPAARLEDDPRFLCIYVDPSEPAHSTDQGLKELANLRAFAFEVLINSVMTTRMRHVARDKPLSTRRALPERPLFLFKCSIAHDHQPQRIPGKMSSARRRLRQRPARCVRRRLRPAPDSLARADSQILARLNTDCLHSSGYCSRERANQEIAEDIFVPIELPFDRCR